jgi:hypothetical protein
MKNPSQLCKCGHPKYDHNLLQGKCYASGRDNNQCTCKKFIPVPMAIVNEPIAVVEIERLGQWTFLFNVYSEKLPLGSSVTLAEELGSVTGIRLRYLKGK